MNENTEFSTLEDQKKRKLRKKLEMQRLCQLLNIENWDKYPEIVKEVQRIVQKKKP